MKIPVQLSSIFLIYRESIVFINGNSFIYRDISNQINTISYLQQSKTA